LRSDTSLNRSRGGHPGRPGRRQRPHADPDDERQNLVGRRDALGRRCAGLGLVKSVGRTVFQTILVERTVLKKPPYGNKKRPVGSLPPSKPPTGPAPPRRPVCAPRGAAPIVEQTTRPKATITWFHSLLRSPKPHPLVAPVRRSPRRTTTPRLWVEALEDRSLPSCTVTLAPSNDSPLVGERVTWTATATDCGT